MKGTFCILIASCFTYVNCRSLSQPIHNNYSSGNNDHRTQSILGIGPSPTFSLRSNQRNQGSNLLSTLDIKPNTNQHHRKQHFDSHSTKISGALGQNKMPWLHEQHHSISMKFGTPVKAPATIEKARIVQDNANRNNAGGPQPKLRPEPNTANTQKTQDPTPPSVIHVKQPVPKATPANSNPSPNPPKTISTNNNPPAQPKAESAINNPTPQQTNPSNPPPKSGHSAAPPAADQSNLAQNSPVPTASGNAANWANNQWFGAPNPGQLAGLAKILMMPERVRETILRLGALAGDPTIFQKLTNSLPGLSPISGVSPTNSTANSSNAMNPMNVILQQQQLRESGIEIPAFQIPTICKGIVPPTPGNETMQQLKDDGMKAALTALRLLRIELSYMEAATLCHNKLQEYIACDVYSNVREVTCQPNVPNQCEPGMQCSIYSGVTHDLLGVIPLCCPTTVLEARKINRLHESGMLAPNFNMPLIP